MICKKHTLHDGLPVLAGLQRNSPSPSDALSTELAGKGSGRPASRNGYARFVHQPNGRLPDKRERLHAELNDKCEHFSCPGLVNEKSVRVSSARQRVPRTCCA